MVGYGTSSLGNGAGSVAVAWLATELAPPRERPYAVGFSLAAYLLPGALVGLAAGRWAHRFDPRLLVGLDGGVRLAGLATIGSLQLAGRLNLAGYVALLAFSSLLLSFGSGGVITLLGSHVDAASRFAANSFVQALNQVSLTVIGPGIGGLLVALLGAPIVIVIDASSYAVLLLAVTFVPSAARAGSQEPGAAARGLGLRGLLARPPVAWLLALTFVFYGFYGPVETAIPILVRHDLRAGPGLLGGFWAAFGVGALIGGLAAGTRTIKNLRRFAVAVVAGWGLALLVVSATDQLIVILVAIAVGGIIYAPYPAASTTLLQKEFSGPDLTSGAVAWSSVANGVVPIGMLIGGPAVSVWGARGTMGASAIATIALAILVTTLIPEARGMPWRRRGPARDRLG
jgi:hypothetical protein